MAIAAVKLGANQVFCVDNDQQTIISTCSNIKNNKVASQITVLHNDEQEQLIKMDLLIANILAKPLVNLCVYFSTLIKSDGQLVLSGILHKQLEVILDNYNEYFSDLKVVKKDDWCRVSGIKRYL